MVGQGNGLSLLEMGIAGHNGMKILFGDFQKHFNERFQEVARFSAGSTGVHAGIQRDLIRAMCIDSGDELHAAWSAILAHGGPERQPEAMRLLEALPDDPEWTRGSFRGLAARGGYAVDCTWEDGRVTDYRITAVTPFAADTVTVSVNGKDETAPVRRG